MAITSTISYMWQQENQKKHVMEIARQSGALYDKFKNFIDDIESIGKSIGQAEGKYEAALKKLYTGKGNIINRIESIKKLGAKTSKSLPQELLDKSEIDILDEIELINE